MNYLKKIHENNRGFTLVELITALIVGAVLVVAISPILRLAAVSYNTSTTLSEAYQSSRIAFNRLLSELRMIPDPSDVTSIASNMITFVDRNGKQVTYSVSNRNLLRNGNLFVEDVSSFIITPKDRSNSSLTPSVGDTSVWSYEINLNVQVFIGKSSKNVSLQGEIFPRNYHLI